MTSVSRRQDDAGTAASTGSLATSGRPGVVHRFVTARGARFHVAQAGAGDPVVLLHGLPLHWYAWRKVIPELAGEYQLYCLDLRGCGWSQATPHGYGTGDQALDVLAVMDALGLDRVTADRARHRRLARVRALPARAQPVQRLRGPERLAPLARPRHADQERQAVLVHGVVGVPGNRGPRAPPLAGITRFMLRRWAGPSYQWDPAELEEFVRASRTRPGSRAVQQALWQFVLRDIPALALRRHRRVRPGRSDLAPRRREGPGVAPGAEQARGRSGRQPRDRHRARVAPAPRDRP